MTDAPDPPRPTCRLRPPGYERVNPAPGAGPAPDPRRNDVAALLELNRAREQAAGRFDVGMPPRRISPRLRDYLRSLVLGNAVLGVATVLQPIFGGAGLILFNVSLAWIVWVVRDAE